MSNYSNKIHLVSFDVPYPPDYGGVIDVFYKIQALKNAGIEVILHTFIYGREKSEVLEKLCSKVFYYKRKKYINPYTGSLPYIVKSRKLKSLLENLSNDNFPVIFEGLHCCAYITYPELSHKFKIVRMHNIEHLYYLHLAKTEYNLFKKYHFYSEAGKLKQFEAKILPSASKIAAITESDNNLLNSKYGNSFYLPVFHENENVNIKAGKGEYALYHGNLGVGENNQAALFLVNKVFNRTNNISFIIAGMNPSKELKQAVSANQNIKLLENLDTNEINELISNAHVNVLPTFQETGIKLKLINVLYKGRFCIVNSKMVKNTGLSSLCILAENEKDFLEQLKNCFETEFEEQEIHKRAKMLYEYFSTDKSVQILLDNLNLHKD